MATPLRWRLDRITVRSFRGIEHELTFDLAGKPALFWGNNGVGKSTIALALQWTLFGRFPEGVLANQRFKQFLPPVSGHGGLPYGEVSFRRGNERLIIRRDDGEQTFGVSLGAKSWEGEAAGSERDLLLGLDMDAFVRTVLLHQTRTRGLLIDEAKARNHAIDMLLGVEAGQNLYDVLKPKPFLDASEQWRADIESQQRFYQAKAELLKEQLESGEGLAREAGFTSKDFKWEALCLRYKTLAGQLAQLGASHGVPIAAIPVPETLQEAHSFSNHMTKAAGQIQTKASIQASLTKVRVRLGDLESLLLRWTPAIQQRDDAAKEVAAAEKRHGSAQALSLESQNLNGQVARLRGELANLNELYQILQGAESYIAGHESDGCPVCEQRVDARKLSRSLERRVQELKSEQIREKESEIKTAQAALQANEGAEKELQRLARNCESRQSVVDQLIPQIGSALGLSAVSDSKAEQRLRAAIQDGKAERDSLEQQARSLVGELEKIRSQLDDLNRAVLPVLEKRAELRALESKAAEVAKEYEEAGKRADRMESIGTRLERIQKALLAGKERLASDRLAAARPRALSIYRQLVRHPRFTTFEITATPQAKKVEYNFVVSVGKEKGTEREARLVLSDGQITATAAGIFISLAESASHWLDLLFIDDPTQNVDRPCKEAIAQLMTEISRKKQVVLSTHDEEFVALLEEQGFHSGAAVFWLGKWDGDPSVNTPAAAGA